MTPTDEILLTTILRRMLVANDDTAILADARGLQRKVVGLGLDPHKMSTTFAAGYGRYELLTGAISERDGARSVARMWEKTAEKTLKTLADSRGGQPPEGYTWRWSTESMDTQEEVTDRWSKRLQWEVKQIIRRNGELHADKAKLEDQVAYLKAALAHVTGKEAA